MRARILGALIPGALLLGISAAAQPSVTLLPVDRLFPPFYADGLEHRLSLGKNLENREWAGIIGGEVPLARYGDSTSAVQAAVAATVFNSILKTPGHISVLTVDYRVDFPLEFRSRTGAFRFGYGHISCHLADDGVTILDLPRRNVVKDYLQASFARPEPALAITWYASAQWNYHILPIPDRHWNIQCGLNSDDYRLGEGFGCYAAADLKLREEVGWGSTRSVQAGFWLAGASGRRVRISYALRDGFEERGQLFDASVNRSQISVAFVW
jgi:hypothetical protein